MVLEVSGLTVCREGAVASGERHFDLAAPRAIPALIVPTVRQSSCAGPALILPHKERRGAAAGRRSGAKVKLPSLVRTQVAYLPQKLPVCATAAHSAWLNSWPGWDPAGIRFNWVGGRGPGERPFSRPWAKPTCRDLADRL